MTKLAIYDPPMCCSTGVCGPCGRPGPAAGRPPTSTGSSARVSRSSVTTSPSSRRRSPRTPTVTDGSASSSATTACR